MALPPLLGAAQRTYGEAIRAALHRAGFEDLPPTGVRLLGSLARGESNVGELAQALGVSKQTASALIDTLVERGYCTREIDESDRRRTKIELTVRGRAAGRAIRASVRRVDAMLSDHVSADDLARTRSTLAALAQLGATTS